MPKKTKTAREIKHPALTVTLDPDAEYPCILLLEHKNTQVEETISLLFVATVGVAKGLGMSVQEVLAVVGELAADGEVTNALADIGLANKGDDKNGAD